MRFILAVIFVLSVVLAVMPLPVEASVVLVNGFVADGYTFNNGYWYQGDQAFTRQLWTQPGYYTYSGYCGSCRTWVAGYDFYRYTPVQLVVQYQQTAPSLPSYRDPGWRGKLLDIAAHRDKIEGTIRQGAFEQQYFMEAVNGLGLSGNFRMNNYGASPPYSQYQAQYGSVTNFGANGQTAYGYSYNTLAQLYGGSDLNTLYQQAAQLGHGVQRAASEAQAGFQTLVGAEGQNRARVAEILARGQMAEQILKALVTPSATVETKGFSFRIGPQGVIEKVEDQTVDPATRQKVKEMWVDLAKNRCASCHTGPEAKKGFDIATYPSFSPARKQEVLKRLTTTDDKVLMPRNQDGSAGARLTSDELRLFLLN